MMRVQRMRHWLRDPRSRDLTQGVTRDGVTESVTGRGRANAFGLGVLRRNICLYLLCIGIAEIFSVLAPAPIGLLAYALVLLVLLIGGSLWSEPADAPVYFGLALVPLLRVVTLGLPLDRFAEQWTYVLVCVPVLFSVAVMPAVAGLGPASLRLRVPVGAGVVPTVLIGASGIALGWLVVAALDPDPLRRSSDTLWVTLALVCLAGLVGLTEELLLRGVVLTVLERPLGVVAAILASSLVSGLLALASGSVAMMALAVGAGLYLGWAVVTTNSLAAAVIARWCCYAVIFTGLSSTTLF
jgi:membrane protease YdiL (CAAX protease family)